jgi:hypothetical protein
MRLHFTFVLICACAICAVLERVWVGIHTVSP